MRRRLEEVLRSLLCAAAPGRVTGKDEGRVLGHSIVRENGDVDMRRDAVTTRGLSESKRN